MSTIEEKLERLARYKQNIKAALFKVGVSVSDDMSAYADAILNIPDPYKCNIVIKERGGMSVSEKLIGLDFTKTRDNICYQYSMSQSQTDDVAVNFKITHLESATVMGLSGFRFCIMVDGGPHNMQYLSLLEGSDYKFYISDTPKYWYSTINPTIANARTQVFDIPSKLKVWKTDVDATGNKVYANGESATDGLLRVEFRKRT